MHIPQTLRHCRRIPGGGTSRAEDNPCVIISRLSTKKPVQHNQEKNTPPWNCQVRHIGCICVLLDAPSEQPDPRVLRSNILTLAETTMGLQNAGPNNKTSESYTSKAIPSYIQAYKHTSEHIHRPTHTHPSERGNKFLQKTPQTFTNGSMVESIWMMISSQMRTGKMVVAVCHCVTVAF